MNYAYPFILKYLAYVVAATSPAVTEQEHRANFFAQHLRDLYVSTTRDKSGHLVDPKRGTPRSFAYNYPFLAVLLPPGVLPVQDFKRSLRKTVNYDYTHVLAYLAYVRRTTLTSPTYYVPTFSYFIGQLDMIRDRVNHLQEAASTGDEMSVLIFSLNILNFESTWNDVLELGRALGLDFLTFTAFLRRRRLLLLLDQDAAALPPPSPSV